MESVRPETLFSIFSTAAAIGWLLLIFIPRITITRTVVRSGLLPILLSIAYAVLFAANLLQAEGGFGSLAEVSALFQNDWLLLAGWVHYLAFDMLVGIWEVGDAEKRGISHLAVAPSLLLTFLFGPIGFLLYLGIRSVKKAKNGDDEELAR